MTQNSLFLDAEIIYYETLSKIAQHNRNFEKQSHCHGKGIGLF